MKTWFIDKKGSVIECKILEEGRSRRIIELLEGPKKGKKKVIPPDGVGGKRFYPRVLFSEEKPGIFNFKGRVLAQHQKTHDLVPKIDPHFAFQPFTKDVIDSINSKENIILTGGTGTGKTTSIVQLAARINQPVVRINFNGETRLYDFLGKMHIHGGNTQWVDGVLPMAMRKGYWLLLDELDFADPAVLSLLHPVLEDNPLLVLKENNGEVIIPHPDFRIFATANSIGAMQDRAGSYSGTQNMNDAFLDRWIILHVPNLPLKDELRVVRGKVPGLRGRWARRIVEFAKKCREHVEEGADFGSDNFSTRRVLLWARKSALLRSPVEGAKIAWLDKIPKGEQDGILKILELFFGKKKEKSQEDIEPKKPGRPKKLKVS